MTKWWNCVDVNYLKSVYSHRIDSIYFDITLLILNFERQIQHFSNNTPNFDPI